MDTIISDTTSEIQHREIEGRVCHVVYRTVIFANNLRRDAVDDTFILMSSQKRKIQHNEFDGYFSGRIYTNVYMKILD